MVVKQCMISFVLTGEPGYVTDKRGWSPLHEAAFAGHPDCLELLLKHGKLCLAVTFCYSRPVWSIVPYLINPYEPGVLFMGHRQTE